MTSVAAGDLARLPARVNRSAGVPPAVARASRPRRRMPSQSSGLSRQSSADLPRGTYLVKLTCLRRAHDESQVLRCRDAEPNSYGRTTLVAIYLGIDGGGSKTSCLIGDETSVLGTGTGAASNVVRVGEAQARESLASAIRQACTVANLEPSEIGSVCVGLAGAARPEISELVRAHRLGSSFPAKSSAEIEVVGDMVIALEAAFGERPGRDRDRRHRLDRLWTQLRRSDCARRRLGIRHLRRGIRPLDRPHRRGRRARRMGRESGTGRAPDRDSDEILAPAKPSSNWCRPPTPRRRRILRRFFPPCFRSADSGDRIARDVLTQAGTHLANLAGILLRRLFPNSEAVPVAMSGGVFGSSALVRQVFYNSLRSGHPDAVLNPNVIEPVRGALELARKGAAK